MKNLGLSVMVGLIASLIGRSYKFVTGKVEELLFFMSSGKLLLCWFTLIPFTTFLIVKMLKKQPCASGSGIPQVRKVLSGQLDYDPLKVFLTKFSAGVLSMFCGYSLGTEGPTVQLGSTVGHFVAKRSREEGKGRKFLISIGACSAMASAFDAPLASVAFLVEGLRYRPRLKQTVFLLFFTLVLSNLSGLIFKEETDHHLSSVVIPSNVKAVFVLAVLSTMLGALLTSICVALTRWKNSKAKISLPISLTLLFAILSPEVLGSGALLIKTGLSSTLPQSKTILLLFIKSLFTAVCFAAKLPGGLFVPSLALGSMLGMFTGSFFDSGQDLPVLVACGMGCTLTAVLRIPISSALLICEMFNQLSLLIAMLPACLLVEAMMRLLKFKPLYDALELSKPVFGPVSQTEKI
ncbi:chloride channel protein [Pseudothermotoga sp.]